MITKILKTDIDWVDVKNSCRNTVNKNPTDNVPDGSFKKKLLLAEHSPIRSLRVTWQWNGIKSWVATHYVRHHEGVEKWVSTQRSDRTGVDRNSLPQDTPVNIKMEANAQALINMSKVRLCYQAAPETRELMEDLKITIGKEVDKHIADMMVPQCVYRGGCPEFSMCKEKFYTNFMMFCKANDIPTGSIQKRYDAYNQYFKQTHKQNNYKGDE